MKTVVEFRKVWEEANKDNAKELILSGWKEKGFTPTSGINRIGPEYKRILDFGCGIGRNLSALSVGRDKVHGFDFPSMITQAAQNESIIGNIKVALYTDWSYVKQQQYDAIHICLVLQHMHPDEIREKMADFVGMTGTIFLHSRAYIDHGGGLVKDFFAPYWKVAEVYSAGGLDYLNAAKEEQHYYCRLGRV
jgi:2-polyprenyl-3-methyl-5-hydroxy-6-metoxy-1,4-benzoquinol methylase